MIVLFLIGFMVTLICAVATDRLLVESNGQDIVLGILSMMNLIVLVYLVFTGYEMGDFVGMIVCLAGSCTAYSLNAVIQGRRHGMLYFVGKLLRARSRRIKPEDHPDWLQYRHSK